MPRKAAAAAAHFRLNTSLPFNPWITSKCSVCPECWASSPQGRIPGHSRRIQARRQQSAEIALDGSVRNQRKAGGSEDRQRFRGGNRLPARPDSPKARQVRYRIAGSLAGMGRTPEERRAGGEAQGTVSETDGDSFGVVIHQEPRTRVGERGLKPATTLGTNTVSIGDEYGFHWG